MGNVFIHETAEVSPHAVIGSGSKVWRLTHIREDAVIGEKCVIGERVYIDKQVMIGNGVKIQNGVNIYCGVTIEDDAFLGPSMTFTNDLHPRAFATDWKMIKTTVKKGASIGANATILCGITIGEYSLVGAGSVVTKDVPAYAMVVGNPAKQVAWVCRCGYKLDQDSTCNNCGEKQAFVTHD